MTPTYLDPFYFLDCPRCGAVAEASCVALYANDSGPAGRPVTRIHPGRSRADWAPPLIPGRVVDEELAARRLSVWWRRASIGDPVEDIAAELGMKRAALDAYIVRARRRGHPQAVYHALAGRV